MPKETESPAWTENATALRSAAMEAYLSDLFECVAQGSIQLAPAAAEPDVEHTVRRTAVLAARTVRLQELTSDLSAALTPAQVAEAITGHVVTALVASRVLVLQAITGATQTDNDELVTLAVAGLSLAGGEQLPRYAVAEATLAGEAFRRRAPVHYRSLDEARARYARDAELYAGLSGGSVLAAPLLAFGEPVGVVLVFLPSRSVTAQDPSWLLAAAAEGGAALRRARLYEATMGQRTVAADGEVLDGAGLQGLVTALIEISGRADLIQRRLEFMTGGEAARALEGMRRLRLELQRAITGARELQLRAATPVSENPACRRPVDVVALIRAAEPRLRARAHEHSVQVVTDESELSGLLEPAFFERLLDDLVDDAVRHHPYGGEITLLLRRAIGVGGQWALITVRDRGRYETAAAAAYAHRETNGHTHGQASGATLRTACAAVAERGGRIDAVSTAGMGSAVTVRLPLQ